MLRSVGHSMLSDGGRVVSGKAVGPRYDCSEPSKTFSYIDDGFPSLLAGVWRLKATRPQQVGGVGLSRRRRCRRSGQRPRNEAI